MSAPRVGALVLFVGDLARSVAFYRAIGLPLEEESHDDGPVHFACELDGIHFALFAYEGGRAPGYRVAGGTMPGFAVASLEDALAALRQLGASVMQEPSAYPWGLRALVEDPDGRAVEVYAPQ